MRTCGQGHRPRRRAGRYRPPPDAHGCRLGGHRGQRLHPRRGRYGSVSGSPPAGRSGTAWRALWMHCRAPRARLLGAADADALPRPAHARRRSLDIGVQALGTTPQKPGKGEEGARGRTVVIGGVVIHEGDWMYADTGAALPGRAPGRGPPALKRRQPPGLHRSAAAAPPLAARRPPSSFPRRPLPRLQTASSSRGSRWTLAPRSRSGLLCWTRRHEARRRLAAAASAAEGSQTLRCCAHAAAPV